MVGEVQVRIVHPHRAALAEGDEAKLLPEPGHQVQARLDVVAKLDVGGSGPLEESRRGDMHVGPVPLQMEERGIKA